MKASVGPQFREKGLHGFFISITREMVMIRQSFRSRRLTRAETDAAFPAGTTYRF
ncbi:MAG: hypothetical protein M0Z79_11100 [Nitrospiraceae bacterium]|nr:hypothetical protein [Nitrospiraceae bacterium]